MFVHRSDFRGYVFKNTLKPRIIMSIKRCFNFDEKLFDNLNIVYDSSSSVILLWNRFQIFLTDEHNLKNSLSISELDTSNIIITQLLLSNNCLLVLDEEANIFSMKLKLKTSGLKRFKNSFRLHDDKILCLSHVRDSVVCLKLGVEKCLVHVYKIESEFTLIKKFELKNIVPQLPKALKLNNYMCCYGTNQRDFESMKKIFNADIVWSNQIVTIITFDRLTVYAFLINLGSSLPYIVPVKLITCPAKINHISITKDSCLNVMIGLSIGTVIKLPLQDSYNIPKRIHLNTAIHKMIAMDNTIIYTDGLHMWQAENISSESNIKFRQLFPKFVKDFVKIGDRMICVTYESLIYTFSLEDPESYLEELKDLYWSAEETLQNTNYVHELLEEVKKNDELAKSIKKEEKYITTLALANRADIMDEIIQYNITVYESYGDALAEDIILTLPDNPNNYLDIDAFYFLIKIKTAPLQHKFIDILSGVFGDLKLHITLLSEDKILKIFSINIAEQWKSLNIVIPLNINLINLTNIIFDIKFVTKIPGSLNTKESLWVILHDKLIELNAEYFIKSKTLNNININFLKEQNETVDELIYKSACHLYGNLFHLTKIMKTTKNFIEWKFYIKLPNNYVDALKCDKFYKEHFNSKRAKFLLKELSSKEFLNSKTTLNFNIGNEKVSVQIINDSFSHPMLVTFCKNPEIAFGLRNFLSNLIHNNFKGYESAKEITKGSLYATAESLDKEIKTCLNELSPSEVFLSLFDKYQRNILGALLL